MSKSPRLEPNEAAERTAKGDKLMLSEPQDVQETWSYKVHPDCVIIFYDGEEMARSLSVNSAALICARGNATEAPQEAARPGKCLRLEHGVACDELAAAVSERDAARFELAQRCSEETREAIRAAAIEECAKAIEARAVKLRAKAKQERKPTTQHYFAQSIELRNIVGTIRALSRAPGASPLKDKQEK